MVTAAPLHLLQRWTQWTGFDGPVTTLAQVEELCAKCVRYDYHLRTMTSRRPKRDLTGGSVYFLSPFRMIVFRLPLVEIEEDDGLFRFVLDPAGLRLTEPRQIRFLRGWRYLTDPPPDLDTGAPAQGGDLPPHLQQELKDLGL